MIGVLIQAVIVLVIIGVVLYLFETYVPISPPIQVVIRVLVVLALALFLLRLFGIGGTMPALR
jgi:hypothetical protein